MTNLPPPLPNPEADWIPEFPPLPDHLELDRLVGDRMPRDYVSREQARFMHQDWQIEQRLASINQARIDGMSQDEADALELEALRELRQRAYGRGMPLPLEALHEIAERSGIEVAGVPEKYPWAENQHMHRHNPTYP